MLSVMISDNKLIHDHTTTFLINRMVELFPAKFIDYISLVRYIGYYEKSIRSVELVIESMEAEGEDEEIIANIKDLMASPKIRNQQEADELRRIMEKFIKYKQLIVHSKRLKQALDEIDENDFSNIEEKVNNVDSAIKSYTEAVRGVNSSSISNTFDSNNRESVVQAIEGARGTINKSRMLFTGIKALNEMLSPAYLPEQFYVYAALPGNYKSGILLSSFCDACKYNNHIVEHLKTKGKKPVVIYITMENTMSQTIRRLWSLLFPNLNFYTYSTTTSAEKMADMITDELESNGFEAVILYRMYREISTRELRDLINFFNSDTQQVVGVFFDYIKRIRPGRNDFSAKENEKSEIETVCNECKAIASELGIPFVTGHQLNRTAATALAEGTKNNRRGSDELLNRSQIGSAWGVMEIADMCMLLNIDTIDDERTLMVKNVKIRDVNKTNDDEGQNEFRLGFRHPFLSVDSFALRPDIKEPRSLSTPCTSGLRHLSAPMAVV